MARTLDGDGQWQPPGASAVPHGEPAALIGPGSALSQSRVHGLSVGRSEWRWRVAATGPDTSHNRFRGSAQTRTTSTAEKLVKSSSCVQTWAPWTSAVAAIQVSCTRGFLP